MVSAPFFDVDISPFGGGVGGVTPFFLFSGATQNIIFGAYTHTHHFDIADICDFQTYNFGAVFDPTIFEDFLKEGGWFL